MNKVEKVEEMERQLASLNSQLNATQKRVEYLEGKVVRLGSQVVNLLLKR